MTLIFIFFLPWYVCLFSIITLGRYTALDKKFARDKTLAILYRFCQELNQLWFELKFDYFFPKYGNHACTVYYNDDKIFTVRDCSELLKKWQTDQK